MFCVVWDYSNSKQKDKLYKQKHHDSTQSYKKKKSYKTEINILPNPGLA